MAKVSVRRGVEGPKHDPYGYTEVTFTRTDGRVVVMHEGLGTWVKVDGARPKDLTELECYEAFEAATGMPFRRAECVPHRVEMARVRRMSRADREAYWAIQAAEEAMLRYAL